MARNDHQSLSNSKHRPDPDNATYAQYDQPDTDVSLGMMLLVSSPRICISSEISASEEPAYKLNVFRYICSFVTK